MLTFDFTKPVSGVRSGNLEGHFIVSRLPIYLLVKYLLYYLRKGVPLAEIVFSFGKLLSFSFGKISVKSGISSFCQK